MGSYFPKGGHSAKFTYNYSKTNAVFLDVKIEKSDEGILRTSVFEKDTNVHQYIEFSSWHPLSCKKGIPFSQAKRYRPITSDDGSFKQDLNSLETDFQRVLLLLSLLSTHLSLILAKLLTSIGDYLKYQQVKVFAVFMKPNPLLLTRGLQISMTC